MMTQVRARRGAARRAGRWLILLVLVVVGCGAAQAAEPDAAELSNQLNHISLDPSQVYNLRGQEITLDRIHIYFHRGFLAFYKKVAGELTGAVFEGEGEVLLMPPDKADGFTLNEFTGSPILEEQFRSVDMRFTDGFGQELLGKARPLDPSDPEQPDGLIARWNPVVEKMASSDSVRILEDLIGRSDLPFFDARIEGKHLGAIDVQDDERLQESILVAGHLQHPPSDAVELWCSFASRASQRRDYEAVQPARALAYNIHTRINPDDSLIGQATVDLESQSPLDRVLNFQISSGLQVKDIRGSAGQKLTFFQWAAGPKLLEQGQPNDWLSVVLPQAVPKGSAYEIRFKYGGNVIASLGNGVLFVGSHGSWYPNLPIGRSRFDMTFEYPEPLTLVATGDRVEQSSSEGWEKSRWVSNGLFTVAGFNVGNYDKLARQVNGTKVTVYATTAVGTYLQRKYDEKEKQKAAANDKQKGADLKAAVKANQPPVRLDPAALLGLVALRAAGAFQYFEKLYGPCGYSHVVITQAPGDLGQGWPELVYLPTISFLPVRQQAALGIESESARVFASGAIAHEVAHQWWGNAVGLKTYHDAWLSEGMATFSSALFMAHQEHGERTLGTILQAYKHDLLSNSKDGKTIDARGPIWLGWRLSNPLSPDGYADIVYKKACWVLQMLRMVLSDPATGSDSNFFRMLRDFFSAYRGKSPDTADFVRFASHYMPPDADLDQDHTLNWFFNEWVYSTEIPAYSIKQKVRWLALGRFLVQGSITQSGVPQDFEMLVPLVAVGADGHVTRLAPVRVDSLSGSFHYVLPEKPAKIEIDQNNILATLK